MYILRATYTVYTLTIYSFDNHGLKRKIGNACISCVHMEYSLLYNNIGGHVTILSSTTEGKKKISSN